MNPCYVYNIHWDNLESISLDILKVHVVVYQQNPRIEKILQIVCQVTFEIALITPGRFLESISNNQLLFSSKTQMTATNIQQRKRTRISMARNSRYRLFSIQVYKCTKIDWCLQNICTLLTSACIPASG